MIDGLKKVVFVGAHCDDEFICAGTLRRLVRQGCQVSMVSFSMAASANDRTGKNTNPPSKREWYESTDRIGCCWRDIPDGGIIPSCDFEPHKQRIGQYVYDLCETFKPDAVITLSPEDENPAHSIVGTQCERVTRGRVPIHIRCQFPWNYGLGRPNLYVSLGDEDLECKAAVIDCYKSQAFRYNYREMLMSYARADGLSVKVPYAEKFELIRGVV